MTEPTITFYDLESIFEKKAFSPNTWRTRFSLNYKGIPYKTVWVEFPDVEPLCKKLGASPTSTKADGSPFYTLPVIQDHKTGAVISDGPLIAEYLDKTYPSTPPLYPAKSLALHHAFNAAFFSALAPLWEFSIPKVHTILNPVSREYFQSTCEVRFGRKFEDVPKGDDRIVKWAKVKAGFGTMDGWLKKSGGPYVMGDVISFADITIVSYVLWLKKLFGEDSEVWQDIKGWHDGRWDGLLALFEKFQGDAF